MIYNTSHKENEDQSIFESVRIWKITAQFSQEKENKTKKLRIPWYKK